MVAILLVYLRKSVLGEKNCIAGFAKFELNFEDYMKRQ